jgi:hypothetical protein
MHSSIHPTISNVFTPYTRLYEAFTFSRFYGSKKDTKRGKKESTIPTKPTNIYQNYLSLKKERACEEKRQACTGRARRKDAFSVANLAYASGRTLFA